MKKIFLIIGCIVMLLTSGCGDDSSEKFSKTSKEISAKQSQQAFEVFKKIGVAEIYEVKADATLNDDNIKGFRVKTNVAQNVIAYFKEGNIERIRFNGMDLYKNEKILASIKDFVMDLNEQTDYQLRCENGVKSILKAPGTAEFPSITEWRFVKTPEKIVVISYVDAQNSFGAKLRNHFKVTFSGDGSKILSFVFNGKELK